METYTVIVFGMLAQVSVALLITWYFMKKQEYFRYRRIVPKAEVLLTFGSQFWIEEYSDFQSHRVQIGNVHFEDLYVYRAVMEDLILLQKNGAHIVETFFSGGHIEIPTEEVKKRMPAYRKKMIIWQDQNQGRPDQSKKPEPPYALLFRRIVSK